MTETTRQQARARAQALVARMTVEEAAAQLRYDAPAIPRLGIPEYNWWSEALHGVARAGTATVFPQAIGLAAAFDTGLLREVADAISTEGRAKFNAASASEDRDIYKGLTFWSPNVNIFRDPRWGRGHETYGEDPYLTARMGVAFVQGLQGEGETLKSAACAKHFAVHSGPESLRHSFDAAASPKDMAETYLPAFEALVKEAKVEAVMGAYNRVNGEPACGSHTLLTQTLRWAWGFEGHVTSDCWAIADFHNHHHVTSTPTQSAALALQNGCDLNCGNTYLVLLLALQEGLVTEDQIRASAIRLMTTRFLLGLQLGPAQAGSPYDNLTLWDIDTEAHNALAREAARKSIVLLKNDGILPLDPNKRQTLAIIGPNADSHTALEGNYNGTAARYTTFLEGIRAAVGERARILYSEGSHLFKNRTSDLARPGNRIQEAAALARMADVTILCVGLDATLEGEEGDTGNEFSSGDKKDLELPAAQRELVNALAATGKPLITVAAAGSALRVEAGNAVLWAGYPGQAGGHALADILFGKESPSGRLPVTFYRSVDDLPPFEDYSMTGRTYRYFQGEALYPFGFGLSYARFAYANPRAADGAAWVTVQNEGECPADEVVQAYVQPKPSPNATPNPRLCGFTRVRLQPGESREVRVPLDPNTQTVINEAGERVPAGPCILYLGGSQPDPRSTALLGAKPVAVDLKIPS